MTWAGTLPDWIALALALGTASLGASYVGHVKRSRLEDRRELLRHGAIAGLSVAPDCLLREDVIEIAAEGRLTVGEDAHFPDPPTGGTRYRIAIFTLRRIASLLDEADEIVRLLPWHDRALWVAAVDTLGSETIGRILGPVENVKISGDSVYLGPEHPGGLLEDYLNVMGAEASWAQFRDRVVLLEEHLLRRVNPRLGSRLIDLRQSSRLVIFGPRPWSKRVRRLASVSRRRPPTRLPRFEDLQ